MDGHTARKLYRPSWAAWCGLIVHAIWLIVLIYFYIAGSSNDDRLPIEWCESCSHVADSVRVADELGRLDWLGLALSILGVGLVVLSLVGFFAFRSAAMYAAREEARLRVKDDLPSLVTSEVLGEALKRNPVLLLNALSEFQDLMRQRAEVVDEAEADNIATANLD